MAMGTNNSSHRLNQVWGPQLDNPSSQKESTSKTKLESMCLEEAGHRFMQACHMPFLQQPLLNIFMEANIQTQAFDQVLQGTFKCPPGTDPMAQWLLAALARPPKVPIIPQWTLDEITAGWQKAREATSSSPSGLHFGHYMAGTLNLMIAIFNTRLTNLGKCW